MPCKTFSQCLLPSKTTLILRDAFARLEQNTHKLLRGTPWKPLLQVTPARPSYATILHDMHDTFAKQSCKGTTLIWDSGKPLLISQTTIHVTSLLLKTVLLHNDMHFVACMTYNQLNEVDRVVHWQTGTASTTISKHFPNSDDFSQ